MLERWTFSNIKWSMYNYIWWTLLWWQIERLCLFERYLRTRCELK